MQVVILLLLGGSSVSTWIVFLYGKAKLAALKICAKSVHCSYILLNRFADVYILGKFVLKYTGRSRGSGYLQMVHSFVFADVSAEKHPCWRLAPPIGQVPAE